MKSILLSLLFLFIPKLAISQIIEPTRYNLDSLHHPTTKNDYKYIRVVENYKNQPDLFIFTEYYQSGTICMKAISKNKNEAKFEGPRIDYYENGNKKQESNYVDNKIRGKQIDWYENKEKKSEKEIVWHSKHKRYYSKTLQSWNKEGKQTVIDGNDQFEYSDDKLYEIGELKNGEKQGIWAGKDLKEKFSFTEIYNEGVLVSGISTDENNTKYTYKELTTKTTPAKGFTDFYTHVGKNFKAPDVKGLKGKIYTTFVIDKDGSITDIRVLRDLGYGSGKEAIKTIASYGKWIPGKTRGVPVKALYSLPITIQTAEGNYQRQSSEMGTDIIKNTNSNW
ncbi:energy transducer TonB [Flavobacterium sp. LB1P71]|uniref:energy transducer TonB n=1 Tax=unclassified Flavobacterium TaxID=196869 RepID=UPI003AAB89F4